MYIKWCMKTPKENKVYIVVVKANLVSGPVRTMATWHKSVGIGHNKNTGYWHLLRESCSRGSEDITDFWLLPPNGEPLGEYGKPLDPT
jgi:hypothetical protein